jgi:hypothetical protein
MEARLLALRDEEIARIVQRSMSPALAVITELLAALDQAPACRVVVAAKALSSASLSSASGAGGPTRALLATRPAGRRRI